jgi:uncharacterized repeat protein (TIGR03803 family)
MPIGIARNPQPDSTRIVRVLWDNNPPEGTTMRTPYKLFFQTAARVLTSFERRHRKRMACRVSALILGFTVAGSITLAGGEDQSPSVLTIYNFNSLKKGADIYGGLIIGPGGVLYGTAEQGGLLTAPCPISTDGCGNVFQLTPPSAPGSGWEETVLHRFGSTANDGYYPAAALTMGPNGVLYGTTAYGGGSSSVGTVFQLTPPVSPDGAWTETIIHAFNASGDGSYPASTLALGTDGILYGTTTGGGTSNYGTVFSLVPPPTPGGTWTESVLHSFTGPPGDGAAPAGGVLVGPGGVLFGATSIGGSLYNGTVYQLTPPASAGDSWAIKLLHSFSATDGDGFTPEAGVTIGAGGVLYGPTDKGGTADYGSIYQLTPSVSPGGP